MTQADWLNIYTAIFVPAAACLSLALCSAFLWLTKAVWRKHDPR